MHEYSTVSIAAGYVNEKIPLRYKTAGLTHKKIASPYHEGLGV